MKVNLILAATRLRIMLEEAACDFRKMSGGDFDVEAFREWVILENPELGGIVKNLSLFDLITILQKIGVIDE